MPFIDHINKITFVKDSEFRDSEEFKLAKAGLEHITYDSKTTSPAEQANHVFEVLLCGIPSGVYDKLESLMQKWHKTQRITKSYELDEILKITGC